MNSFTQTLENSDRNRIPGASMQEVRETEPALFERFAAAARHSSGVAQQKGTGKCTCAGE